MRYIDILLFSMETFDLLMDWVDELLVMTQSDPNTLPQLYLDQIREDSYSRWFAYDVTRNHLRYYQDYRSYNIEFMDNKRGPRWALYPEVMVLIDRLMDDGSIAQIDPREYKQSLMYINSDSVGLVGDYQKSMEGNDAKLEYLDIRIRDSGELMLNLQDHLFPRLTHLHMLVGSSAEPRVFIRGPMIKFLSSNTDHIQTHDKLINTYLRPSDVQLDYLQIYHGVPGEMNIITSTYHVDRGDSGYSNLEYLIDPDMKYLDIATPGRPYRTLRDIMEIMDGPQRSQLNHLGFDIVVTDADYYDKHRSLSVNTFAELNKYIDRLSKLTSLSVPVLNSHMTNINRLSNQLVHLELHYVNYIKSAMSMPSKLKHIRTLHLSFPTAPYNNINVKMGRWNLPDTCNILSMYTKYSINEFNVNFDLVKFRNLKYLMTKYHEDIVNTWIQPILSTDVVIAIVDYPSSPEEMIREFDYIVVWEYSIPLMVLTTEQLIELLQNQVVKDTYNTHAFIKRQILVRHLSNMRSINR